MGWQTFEQEIKKLSEKIEFNNYHPDMIFGITRGGVVPARLLSSSLLVKDMICISVRKIGGERKVITDILDDIFGKNVLLVEDMPPTPVFHVVSKVTVPLFHSFMSLFIGE